MTHLEVNITANPKHRVSDILLRLISPTVRSRYLPLLPLVNTPTVDLTTITSYRTFFTKCNSLSAVTVNPY